MQKKELRKGPIIGVVLGFVIASITFAANAEAVEEATESADVGAIYGEPVPIKTTAYCPCKDCCGHTHGITKSGRKAVAGLTVASNTYFGKTVIVYDETMNYIGIYEVMDTGTDGMDIFYEDHQEALEFGVHNYYIQVVDAAG